MTKIAIVGFGWLGKPLGQQLVEQGYKVVGTTRNVEKIAQLALTNLEAFYWNSREDNPILADEIVTDTAYCILNFPPGKVNDVQEYGGHLLFAAQQFSEKTHFIFVSTTGVYPEYIVDAKEDSFAWEENASTNHLAYAEQVLRNYLQDRLTIIRMAGLIGPNRHPARFFAGRVAIANGNQPVNLIEQKDSIQIILHVLSKNYWGKIVNACASQHPTRNEYYTESCRKFGFELPEFIEEGEGKVVNNEKSIRELGIRYGDLSVSPYL
jgi:nucleoside-diphosphate-sugar epimerase